MLSGFAQPDENETVSSTTEASAGNAIVETTADVNSSKDGNNLSVSFRSSSIYLSGVLHIQRLP